MEHVVSVSNMRKSDAHTIEHHISGKELMRRAAEGVFSSMDFTKKRVAIICGSGNNGGDGYALAEICSDNNISCNVFRTSEHFSEDGLYYCKRAEKKGIFIDMLDEDISLEDYDIIVDCIFGTGFKGEPEGLAKTAIEKINNSGTYVVSIDINSGLNGDSGIAKCAVKSNLTVSIGYYKTGMFLNDAPKYIKKLVNKDIGIHLEQQQYHLINKSQTKHFMGYGSEVMTAEEFCEKFEIDLNEPDFVSAVVSKSCQTKKILIIKNTKTLMIADQTYVYFQADYAKTKD